MNELKCEIVRWISDEPIPGWVEVRVTDVHGKTWIFYDKPPIFTTSPLTSSSTYPVEAVIRCKILRRSTDSGRTIVTVRTVDLASDGDDYFDLEVDERQLLV